VAGVKTPVCDENILGDEVLLLTVIAVPHQPIITLYVLITDRKVIGILACSSIKICYPHFMFLYSLYSFVLFYPAFTGSKIPISIFLETRKGKWRRKRTPL
jgi:hypothetical protein